MELTKHQRAFLRKRAHDLKPVVQIGKNGMTERLIDSANLALDSHELIKIKFLDFQDQKREYSEQLAALLDGELITVIGNIAVMYRQQSDPERRRINLPNE